MGKLTEPAMLIPSDTFLFRTYKEEILHTSKQLEEINSAIKVINLSEDEITIENIEIIISTLEWSDFFDNDDHEKIVGILNNNQNPYG